jgi:predicted transcriptional regulator
MKRSRSDITLEVLNVCRNRVSKTRIVYKANLNFNIATTYIDLLSEKGLLSIGDGPRTLYETTPQGIEAIKTLRQLGNFLS